MAAFRSRGERPDSGAAAGAAAAAIKRVSDLKETYQQQLAAASPDDKQRITDEANQAFVKAVTDQGLSIDEYNSILQVAQNDPDVRGKILKRIRSSVQ